MRFPVRSIGVCCSRVATTDPLTATPGASYDYYEKLQACDVAAWHEDPSRCRPMALVGLTALPWHGDITTSRRLGITTHGDDCYTRCVTSHSSIGYSFSLGHGCLLLSGTDCAPFRNESSTCSCTALHEPGTCVPISSFSLPELFPTLYLRNDSVTNATRACDCCPPRCISTCRSAARSSIDPSFETATWDAERPPTLDATGTFCNARVWTGSSETRRPVGRLSVETRLITCVHSRFRSTRGTMRRTTLDASTRRCTRAAGRGRRCQGGQNSWTRSAAPRMP